MLRLIPLALAAGLVATVAPAATRTYPAAGFDRVELAAAADVAVHRGPRFAVQAEGEPEAIARLDIAVRQGALVIGWRPGTHEVEIHSPLRVSVTMPRLAAVALSGAGGMTVDEAAVPRFRADVSGAGGLRIAALRAEEAELTVGGAGSIRAAGMAQRLDAGVSGVGTIDVASLSARAGRLRMSGTGSIRARVDGPVQVEVSGVGQVDVAGHPRCAVRKSGVGTVRCAG